MNLTIEAITAAIGSAGGGETIEIKGHVWAIRPLTALAEDALRLAMPAPAPTKTKMKSGTSVVRPEFIPDEDDPEYQARFAVHWTRFSCAKIAAALNLTVEGKAFVPRDRTPAGLEACRVWAEKASEALEALFTREQIGALADRVRALGRPDPAILRGALVVEVTGEETAAGAGGGAGGANGLPERYALTEAYLAREVAAAYGVLPEALASMDPRVLRQEIEFVKVRMAREDERHRAMLELTAALAGVRTAMAR